MIPRKKCCFLFFDYLDFDIYLNAIIFYRLAGFEIVSPKDLNGCHLAVLFRGIPDSVYSKFTGLIHFYDYVCEHQIEILDYFPCASSVVIISLKKSDTDYFAYKYVYGYLPVFPGLWHFSLPFVRRSSLPLHLSNYKPLKSDSYQDQLISKIKSGMVRVYGAKWDRVQIIARSCSFLSANLLLSQSHFCYGLMYPYQRGKSLSGRMWQAPIQGCIVISETNTNFFSCPGVLEVPSYDEPLTFNDLNPDALALQASRFWLDQTTNLASKLDLSLSFRNLPIEIFKCRFRLLLQHVTFSWDHSFGIKLKNIRSYLFYVFRRIGKQICRPLL